MRELLRKSGEAIRIASCAERFRFLMHQVANPPLATRKASIASDPKPKYTFHIFPTPY